MHGLREGHDVQEDPPLPVVSSQERSCEPEMREVCRFKEIKERQYPKGEHGNLLKRLDILWTTSFHFSMSDHDRLIKIINQYFKQHKPEREAGEVEDE